MTTRSRGTARLCCTLGAVALLAACTPSGHGTRDGAAGGAGGYAVPAVIERPAADGAVPLTYAELMVSRPPDSPLMAWPDLTLRPQPVPSMTIRIGPSATDIVDLWLPDGEGPHPAVLMIHGGCWQKSIADRTLMNPAAELLRRAGFAVWNIEYRGVDEPGGGYPGTYRDVAQAADALSAHGARFGIDTSRIVAYGHSAGGHLAVWLTVREELPAGSALRGSADPAPIYAAVSSGGLVNLEASAPVTLESCLGAVLEDLTGPAAPGRPDPFIDTSPDRLFPTGSRILAIHATNDSIAPPSLGRDLVAAAEAAGDRAAFLEVRGGHVELIAPGTAAFEATTALISGLHDAP